MKRREPGPALRWAWELAYGLCTALLYPVNLLLAFLRRRIVHARSVLHISYLIHVPYETVALLRRCGIKADYLAIGRSAIWDRCDFPFRPSLWPPIRALQETYWLWKVVARYQVIHCHFMTTLSTSGWELPLLRRMGRKVVVHFRGCEIRDRDRNLALHPAVNICQECDYRPYLCRSAASVRRRRLARTFGDAFLVTTPDMRDFIPKAEHFPFFSPEIGREHLEAAARRPRPSGTCKIVHVTVHPGIEGTREIEGVVERLRQKGWAIDFVNLRNVPRERVFLELRDADLSLGKLKMGYYANAQIESMCMGVPAVTWVRPEFMTPELAASGFILTTLGELEATLEHYLRHPEELEAKRRIARASVLRLHDNQTLSRRLCDLYARLAGWD